jgi:enoyl-CoA hydratase/carnithine racemase
MSALPPKSQSFGQIRPGTNLLISRRGDKGNIILAALHRPHVKNAFDDGLYTDLIHLLRISAEDDGIDAIVLTGTGTFFSSGADLSNFAENSSTLSAQFMKEMLNFPKVICAAVNGPAIGIGVTLLLHCDLCYCSCDATFWIPFTRIALVPEFCSSILLVERMGLSKANDLLLLGKKIDAQTAKEVNLCSNVIDLKNCEERDDPFAYNNIGDIMCRELNDRLFSLPHSSKSSRIFVNMVRGRRRKILVDVCEEEMNILLNRIVSGEVREAATAIRFGRSKL